MPRATTAESRGPQAASTTILLVGLLAIFLSALSYARLYSVLLSRYSGELYRTGDAAEANAAALQSQQWAPWRREGHLARATAWAPEAGSRSAVVADALRWSPSDPYLWAEMARVLALENSFGKAYTAALRNVDEIAPNSPQLHLLRVQAGLRYWHRGDAATRDYWLKSMQFWLKAAPRRFLRQLQQHGEAQRFCWTAGMHLDMVGAWCDAQLKD